MSRIPKYYDYSRQQGPAVIIPRQGSILYKSMGDGTGGDLYRVPHGIEATIEFFNKGKEDRSRRIHHCSTNIICSGTDIGITVEAKGIPFLIPSVFAPFVYYV